MNYHINRGGQQFGPVSLADLQNMTAQGQISPNDLAWCEGMPSWTPVSQVLASVPAAAPQPPPQRRETVAEPAYPQQYGQPQPYPQQQYAPQPQYPPQQYAQPGAPSPYAAPAYNPGLAPQPAAVNDWLQRVQARLSADRYQFLPNPSSYTEQFQLAARLSRFQASKFGNYETFFVFSDLGVPDVGRMSAFTTAAFDYAKRNKKSGLPCGFFEAVACYCVAIVGAAQPELVYFIRNNTPKKHMSAFEIPVLFDASQGQLHYLEKTPVWGAAYWRGFRKEIEKYLR
jgi:GYF domain 2